MQTPEAVATEDQVPPKKVKKAPRTQEEKDASRKRLLYLLALVVAVLAIVYFGIHIGWAGVLFVGYLIGVR